MQQHLKSFLTSADREQILNRLLIDSLTEYAVFAVSPAGIVISWNPGAQQIFGYTQAEIIDHSFDTFFTLEDIGTGAPQTELAIALSTGKSHHDRWHMRKDGSCFWGSNTVQPLDDPSGTIFGFTKLVRDTTAGHIAAEELSDSEQQLRLLVESVRDYAIFSLGPDGTVATWSDGAQRIFGYPQSDIIGQHSSLLFSLNNFEAGVAEVDLLNAATCDSIDIERWLVRKDGSTFLASGKISRLKANAARDRRGFVILVHDGTERHLAAETLRRQAHYDALTGLPNRSTFDENIERSISLVKRHSANSFAVMFIDLDRFKAVNDEFGHLVADEVLVLIARRLEACVRSGDIVSRVGGDEFAILLNGVHDSADADYAAQRILDAMRQPLKTQVGDVFATVCLGIAIATPKYDRPQQILRDADAAMYVAKSQGQARAVIFDDSIGRVLRENIDITADLRHAIERNELRLAYQPVLRLRDKVLIGFESLVRWEHPRRGLLQPDEFIGQAEDSNLIIAVDRWVLSQACAQIVQWQIHGLAGPEIQMSVNVSSKEFSRVDFVTDVRDVLTKHALGATSLRLEITEGTMLERSTQTYEVLASVRALGVNVDVDDFGTGYASLSALNQVVVDGLKIDWSFVTSANAHHGWDIVDSVITLAHKLGLVAIAEGIETDEQLDQLVDLGCDFGQGHLFAQALDPVAAADFLRERLAH